MDLQPLHQVRSVSVNESTEGQTALPGSGEVVDSNAMVTTSLLLTPA